MSVLVPPAAIAVLAITRAENICWILVIVSLYTVMIACWPVEVWSS